MPSWHVLKVGKFEVYMIQFSFNVISPYIKVVLGVSTNTFVNETDLLYPEKNVHYS